MKTKLNKEKIVYFAAAVRGDRTMIPNFYPGKFIVIDGLDGSGKSTQPDLLEKYFLENKISYWRTKEPTDSNDVGIKINRILKKLEIPPDHKTLQEWFTEDRRLHQDKIIKHY